jgi:hypothetical protein
MNAIKYTVYEGSTVITTGVYMATDSYTGMIALRAMFTGLEVVMHG